MGIFRRKVPQHYIPIHPDNIGKNDWLILLEAGTIVGQEGEKLRVAKATLEKKIKRKYNIFLRKRHFLVLEEYNPRIHALYFCPQLYKFDPDNKLDDRFHETGSRGTGVLFVDSSFVFDRTRNGTWQDGGRRSRSR
jgi:hypothetical protein